MIAMHWCALHTKPDKEQEASSFLESKGYEAYLPSMPMRNRIQGKIVPFFSCYLFLHASSPLDFSTVARTPGLIPILSFGGELTPVPNQADALISDRLARMRRFEHGGHFLTLGDPVVVNSQPLAPFRGAFEGACLRVECLDDHNLGEVDTDCPKRVY